MSTVNPVAVSTTAEDVGPIAKAAVAQSRKRQGYPRSYKQALTVIYHVLDGMSIYAAAIKAGYSESTANNGSIHRAVANLEPFAAELRERKMAVARKALDVNTERVLEALAAQAFFNFNDYYEDVELENGERRLIGRRPTDLSHEQMMAVERVIGGSPVKLKDGRTVVDYQYKWYSRAGALKRVGDHLGMFNPVLQAQREHERQMAKRRKRRDLGDVPTEELMDALEAIRGLTREPPEVVDGEYTEID